MFKSLNVVDKVIINAPIIITKDFINKYNIDMVIHAHNVEENEKYFPQHKYAIELNKFTRFEYNKGLNTTDIISRIKEGVKNGIY